MPVTIAPERPDSPEARVLVDELQAHLSPLYPATSQHGFSVQRLIDEGVDFFVLRVDGLAAACGGILLAQDADGVYGEMKRMWVRPANRGAGFGKQIVEHLAAHARHRGATVLRLETGIHQREAIGLYERMGFHQIPPFGPYVEDPLTLWYERPLD